MATPPIALTRGLPCKVTWTFPDTIDLTGTAVYMTAKTSKAASKALDTDTDAIFKKRQVTHLTTHSTEIELTTEDVDYAAGRYVYDIVIVDIATAIIKYATDLGDLKIKPRGTANIDEVAS